MSSNNIHEFGLAGYSRFKRVFRFSQMANAIMTPYKSVVQD